MKPTHPKIIFTLTVILTIIYFSMNMFDDSKKPIETIAPVADCWVESYPVTKLLRQVSWRDKTFVENANVHNALEISEGNMDFVLTVEAESQFDPEAVGDHGHAH